MVAICGTLPAFVVSQPRKPGTFSVISPPVRLVAGPQHGALSGDASAGDGQQEIFPGGVCSAGGQQLTLLTALIFMVCSGVSGNISNLYCPE